MHCLIGILSCTNSTDVYIDSSAACVAPIAPPQLKCLFCHELTALWFASGSLFGAVCNLAKHLMLTMFSDGLFHRHCTMSCQLKSCQLLTSL